MFNPGQAVTLTFVIDTAVSGTSFGTQSNYPAVISASVLVDGNMPNFGAFTGSGGVQMNNNTGGSIFDNLIFSASFGGVSNFFVISQLVLSGTTLEGLLLSDIPDGPLSIVNGLAGSFSNFSDNSFAAVQITSAVVSGAASPGDPTPVPEPSTLMIFGAGLVTLGIRQLRKKRAPARQ
jgi:hypothetical protein